MLEISAVETLYFIYFINLVDKIKLFAIQITFSSNLRTEDEIMSFFMPFGKSEITLRNSFFL